MCVNVHLDKHGHIPALQNLLESKFGKSDYSGRIRRKLPQIRLFQEYKLVYVLYAVANAITFPCLSLSANY
jgi:hypothetical protein